MRFIFICGSLENGKDGVGDYTKILTSKLVELGVECLLISINDYYINTEVFETLEIKGKKIDVFRIPSLLKSKLRYEIARKFIMKSKVDVISLQFVPYSFHTKGLPYSFISFVNAIAKEHFMNIMFHEIWLDNPIKTFPHLHFFQLLLQLWIRNIDSSATATPSS